MRLTLRTLLAYLDDRLSPANARELGQKLAKSPFATELATRIKEVVRRRRLASEDLPQKSIDANLIAEYLDDQLTPELVALIEKEILASDHSLAEVAATHQILGLLSDPVAIDDTLRKRLHKLDPVAAAKEAVGRDAASATANGKSEHWQPLQKQAEPQKRSPMMLLAVMVVGWLVLLVTDSNLFRGTADSKGQPAEDAGQQVADINGGEAKPSVPDVTENPDARASVPTTQTAATPEKVQPDPGTTNVVVASSDPVPSANVGEVAKPMTTGNDKTSSTPADMPAPEKTAAATDVTPKIESSPAENDIQRIELIDVNRVVVLQDKTNGWVRAESLGTEPTKNWLTDLSAHFVAVAEPFSAKVNAPGAGWSAEVIGPAVFRVNTDGSAALQLIEGRLLVRRHGRNDNATQFRLLTGGRAVELTIPTDESVIAVSVVALSASPSNIDAAAGDDADTLLPITNSCLLEVSAPDSDVHVTTAADKKPMQISQGLFWKWDTTSDLSTDGAQSQSNMIPDWVFEAKAPKSQLQMDLMTETAAGYRTQATMSGGALSLSENRNPQIAAYGVRQLSLLRSVDDLVSLLMLAADEATRREVIVGLHVIVQQSPAAAERIQAAMETRLPGSELNDAMKLIRGISRVSAEDQKISGWLVGMLDSQRVAFRDLAIFNLERLTNERYGYFSNDDSGRRDAAVRRWKRYLDRNNGRLIALPN